MKGHILVLSQGYMRPDAKLFEIVWKMKVEIMKKQKKSKYPISTKNNETHF